METCTTVYETLLRQLGFQSLLYKLNFVELQFITDVSKRFVMNVYRFQRFLGPVFNFMGVIMSSII